MADNSEYNIVAIFQPLPYRPREFQCSFSDEIIIYFD